MIINNYAEAKKAASRTKAFAIAIIVFVVLAVIAAAVVPRLRTAHTSEQTSTPQPFSGFVQDDEGAPLLRSLAGRSEGAAGVQALNDAVSAYRLALEVRTRE